MRAPSTQPIHTYSTLPANHNTVTIASMGSAFHVMPINPRVRGIQMIPLPNAILCIALILHSRSVITYVLHSLVPKKDPSGNLETPRGNYPQPSSSCKKFRGHLKRKEGPILERPHALPLQHTLYSESMPDCFDSSGVQRSGSESRAKSHRHHANSQGLVKELLESVASSVNQVHLVVSMNDSELLHPGFC